MKYPENPNTAAFAKLRENRRVIIASESGYRWSSRLVRLIASSYELGAVVNHLDDGISQISGKRTSYRRMINGSLDADMRGFMFSSSASAATPPPLPRKRLSPVALDWSIYIDFGTPGKCARLSIMLPALGKYIFNPSPHYRLLIRVDFPTGMRRTR